jgi:predicted AAA+ superfamily ATPase
MKTFFHERNYYLDRIESYLGKPVIKGITGLRRIGKSMIMKQMIAIIAPLQG